MNREKKLMINTAFYFMGSLGKGMSTMVIILIGSHYITPSELGIYDLVVSTISLIQPIVIFQINDSIYRWLLDDDMENKKVIVCGYRVAITNICIATIVFVVLDFFFKIENFMTILLLLNINCIYPIVQQITRGLKHHYLFANSGIMNAILIFAFSLYLTCYLRLGILGLLFSQIIANLISIIYLVLMQKSEMILSFRERVPCKLKREMIQYSLMLIPNSVNQWLIKAIDKYCILFFLTTFDNGIYSVAHRFPEILLMLGNMFYSSWVEQAIVEYNCDDRDTYFSEIFDRYSNVLFGFIFILIPLTKYVVPFVVGIEYQESWRYIPFLYLGVILSSFSSFFGTSYLSEKKTKEIMKSSCLGVAVNVVMNVLCMKKMGLQVAGISSFLAYLVMWLVRAFDARIEVRIKVRWLKVITLFIIGILCSIFIMHSSIKSDCVLIAAMLILCIALNYKGYSLHRR